MVILYTMKQCPYCVAAKNLLNKREVSYKEILVSEDDDALWEDLYRRSGMKTMPQIFMQDRLIGGFHELNQLDKQDDLASLK